MSALSNYLENELLDHALGTGAFTAPTNVYVALFTTDPTDAGSGTEVSGAGYTRQLVTFGSASGGTASNSSEETFTASGGNFGTVTHIGIYDASSGGNLLFHGALTASRTINDGESLVFSVGAIDITLA
jgi:hypothetical protein